MAYPQSPDYNETDYWHRIRVARDTNMTTSFFVEGVCLPHLRDWPTILGNDLGFAGTRDGMHDHERELCFGKNEGIITKDLGRTVCRRLAGATMTPTVFTPAVSE